MAYDQKVLGYNSIVKVDENDDGLSFTTIGYIKEITPPPLEWNTVDGTTLEDVFEKIDGGIQKATEFTFTQIWIVKSTNHEIIDTLGASKAKVDWQVIYPQGTTVTDKFEGWVKKIAPAVKGNNEYWSREITVQTTSAITRT